MNEFTKTLFEYNDKFGEAFPLYMLMGTGEEELIQTMKNCIKNNKKYKFEGKMGKNIVY